MSQKMLATPLLIGTTSRVVELINSDHEKIASSLSLTQAEVSSVCPVTKEMFCVKTLDMKVQFCQVTIPLLCCYVALMQWSQ